MLTYRIISRYKELGDLESLHDGLEKSQLFITCNKCPLYDPKEILEKLKDDSFRFITATQQSRKDLTYRLQITLPSDVSKLRELVRIALTKGKYLNSQWCKTSDAVWAACDSYKFEHTEYIQNAHKYMTSEIYLKFALNNKGQALLIVSAHPPKN